MADILDEARQDWEKERYTHLAKRFGPFIGAALLGIILVVAIAQGVSHYNRTQITDDAALFHQAMRLIEQEDPGQAKIIFHTLLNEDDSGYAQLAGLQLAHLAIQEGNTEQAIELYRQTAELGYHHALDDLATLMHAKSLITEAPNPEAESLLKGLIASNSTWQYTASELLATYYLDHGEQDDALTLFKELQTQAKAPESLRERAKKMVALLDG